MVSASIIRCPEEEDRNLVLCFIIYLFDFFGTCAFQFVFPHFASPEEQDLKFGQNHLLSEGKILPFFLLTQVPV